MRLFRALEQALSANGGDLECLQRVGSIVVGTRDARRVNNPVKMPVSQRISADIRCERLSPITKRANKRRVCDPEIIQHANLARLVEDLLIEVIKDCEEVSTEKSAAPAIKICLPESVSTSFGSSAITSIKSLP